MNKTAKLLIASGYFAIIIFTVCAILAFGRSYIVYLPNPYNSHTVDVRYSEEGIIENSEAEFSQPRQV